MTGRLTASLFFAVMVDQTVMASIEELARSIRGRATPIPSERLHVTLQYLGAFDSLPVDLVERTKAAAATIASPPADITLDQIETFASRRPKHPIVLSGEPSDSLSALEIQLANALAVAGIKIKRHPHFTPHITLFYDTQRIPKSAIEPLTWQASQFALIHSHLGQSRHETLMTWPLNS